MRMLLMAVMLASCSHFNERHPDSSPRQTSWQAYLMEEVYPKGLQDVFPDAHHLKKWQVNGNFVIDGKVPTPNQLQEVPLDCSDKRLWPTHPQQSTKEYVHSWYANYSGQVPVDSMACTTPSHNGRFCVRTTWANLVVMSDTYEDSCGNSYRAYWVNAYLESDEGMGTLVSPGRTVYAVPNSPMRGDYQPGQTYPQQEKYFLLLTRLLPGDAARIKTNRDLALKSRYLLKDHQFVLKE